MKHPKELLTFSQLLYNQLSSLKIILVKYREINRHYFKDEQAIISLKHADQSMIIIMKEIQHILIPLNGGN